MSRLKFSLKIGSNISIGEAWAPWAPPSYTLVVVVNIFTALNYTFSIKFILSRAMCVV